MMDMTKKIKSKGTMDANNSCWVSEQLAADCKKNVDPPRMGGHSAATVQFAV